MRSLVTIGIVLASLACAGLNPSWAQDTETDEAQFEHYLQRLGLSDMLMTHLEQKLSQISPESADFQSARQRLANFYTNRLQFTPDNETTARMSERAARLFEVYPGFENFQLRVALVNFRYRVLNRDFYEWWYGRRLPRERDRLDGQFRELTRDLSQLQSILEAQRTAYQLETESSGLARRRLQELDGSLDQVDYLSGWCGLSRSQLDPTRAGEWLQFAEDRFRAFLQLDENQVVGEYSDSWFDRESPWSARG